MNLQRSSGQHPLLLRGIPGSGWREASCSLSQGERAERSVLVILPGDVGISEADALAQSLEQLEFRVALVGAESSARPPHGAEPDATLPPHKAIAGDLDEWDAAISFGDESLHLLTHIIPRVRASVHVGAAALAFDEIVASLGWAMKGEAICGDGDRAPGRHKALLLDTGSIRLHATPTHALRHRQELPVLRVNAFHQNRPYADPLIIELARRHLAMWS